MKDKLEKIKKALEHAIRVMEEEIYVTRDQERAVALIDEIIATMDSPELTEDVSKAIFVAAGTNVDLWPLIAEHSRNDTRRMGQAAINTIKEKL